MIRKTTSLTLFFSGMVLLLSSVVLCIRSPIHTGHSFFWAFMGLSRYHWSAVHLNIGILFCIAMLVHVCCNWKPLAAYMTFGIRPGKFLYRCRPPWF